MANSLCNILRWFFSHRRSSGFRRPHFPSLGFAGPLLLGIADGADTADRADAAFYTRRGAMVEMLGARLLRLGNRFFSRGKWWIVLVSARRRFPPAPLPIAPIRSLFRPLISGPVRNLLVVSHDQCDSRDTDCQKSFSDNDCQRKIGKQILHIELAVASGGALMVGRVG